MTGDTAGGLPLFHQTVRDDWIDYNGHLNEAYYVLVFGFATDALMDAAGLDAAYRGRTGCSLYTVEAHVRYLHEVARGSELTVRTTVLGVDDRKLRLLHEMFTGAPSGSAVATEELFALHVDRAAGGAAPLPDASREYFAGLLAPAPPWAGNGIRAVRPPR
ncbi:acyl-CoA thioester hydrolase [Streptomyces sp. 2224.1]|uniref:thioesterase family protein n=1 Tax=unclassified Streptomyces TaxID=2593676 RepID=UPI00088FBA07|nr:MULTISPECIES: thioesterase family protein [unclassified Streptomyces]PBC86285.1 acyl-CoA thioester hydrolase [Streptomyces sp. 2321.6]SDQ90026.1 acyl-CoA thioester hydrolase/carnitine 3-dehydrogenase [Streptomyces sp. KS_16]SED93655.1 acyl-CoA thioester hydrolase [Streptomyces sp. 2133.1]SED95577.1 acyl-CoA thioester hydrolase [Streptomyces sp. 2224.1]SNC73166.1 acyl-CoA thioester hydrolase [Streptomyces sp. 2114.4]